MKTTIEIGEHLLRRAKSHAAGHGVPVHTVLEQALQAFLDQQERPRTDYEMPDASVGGGAIRPGFAPWHWDKVAGLAHEDDAR